MAAMTRVPGDLRAGGTPPADYKPFQSTSIQVNPECIFLRYGSTSLNTRAAFNVFRLVEC